MMRSPLSIAASPLIAFALILLTLSDCSALPKKRSNSGSSTRHQEDQFTNAATHYRGWDYLVSQLRKTGVAESDLSAIYQDPRMPRFNPVYFKVKPKEPKTIYKTFLKDSFAQLGTEFIQEHEIYFDAMERAYNVPREVVTAILVVETQIGRYTGKESIVYRLSRLAGVLDPRNVETNYRKQRLDDPQITLEDVRTRGRYLEDTFLPEIPALIQISRRNRIDIFDIRGSSAGAFGLPQFLPSALIKYGVDGDGDGQISLFNKIDALWSTGNYLAAFGYRSDISEAAKRRVIWEYNRSDAYIDTVLELSRRIRALINLRVAQLKEGE